MAMPQRDETIEEIKRLEPPSPRLRPTLKLRHDKSAGQVRCLNTPSCMETKPRPPASAQSFLLRSNELRRTSTKLVEKV